MPAPSPVRLTCVDAHQLLFRAFYGLPALITSRDKERDLTGAFGFFALLRAGLRDNIAEPTEVVAVFGGEDGAAKRKAIDPGYKANRPEATPAPIMSLADVKRGLNACGIRWIEISDEEADDVIAALATGGEPTRHDHVRGLGLLLAPHQARPHPQHGPQARPADHRPHRHRDPLRRHRIAMVRLPRPVRRPV
jgi:5'-3' exonuclease